MNIFRNVKHFPPLLAVMGTFKREHCKYCVGYNEKGESNIHHRDRRALNESDSSGETKRKLNALVNLKKEHELDFLVPLINAVSNDVHCKRVSDSFIYLFIYYISTSFGKLLIVAKIFMQKLTFFKSV